MNTAKFDNHDRRRVVVELEEHLGVEFSLVGRQKYFKLSEGVFYCVLGGTGDWHGIPPDVFEAATRKPSQHKLILAKKLKGGFQVYGTQFGPFADGEKRLNLNERGSRHFDTERTGLGLRVKQLGVTLGRWFEFDYSPEEREREELFIKLSGASGSSEMQLLAMRLLRRAAKDQASH